MRLAFRAVSQVWQRADVQPGDSSMPGFRCLQEPQSMVCSLISGLPPRTTRAQQADVASLHAQFVSARSGSWRLYPSRTVRQLVGIEIAWGPPRSRRRAGRRRGDSASTAARRRPSPGRGAAASGRGRHRGMVVRWSPAGSRGGGAGTGAGGLGELPQAGRPVGRGVAGPVGGWVEGLSRSGPLGGQSTGWA